MKKTIIAWLLFSTAWASQPDFWETSLQETEKVNSNFTYVSIGATGSLTNRGFLVPDSFIGRRQFLTSRLALDFGAGVLVGDRFIHLYYLQSSLLYYPTEAKGFYLGAGLTGGAFIWRFRKLELPWANIPVTAGYQFKQKGKIHSFLQMQLSPITTPYLGIVNLSWGLGF